MDNQDTKYPGVPFIVQWLLFLCLEKTRDLPYLSVIVVLLYDFGQTSRSK